jgi:hypothetical protein
MRAVAHPNGRLIRVVLNNQTPGWVNNAEMRTATIRTPVSDLNGTDGRQF